MTISSGTDLRPCFDADLKPRDANRARAWAGPKLSGLAALKEVE
jgi:hypothetical protein